MSKLHTDRHKHTAREFWKNSNWWWAGGLLLYFLCDILGDGFRPILSESGTAQVDVEGGWGQLIDSLYFFFKSVSIWFVLVIGAGTVIALLITALVLAIRRLFLK